MTGGVRLIVMAKAPEAGRSKTRLCPPLSPDGAAAVAAAALEDTLEVVRRTCARSRTLVLDGAPGPWSGPGLDVLPQRGEGLDGRLAAAFEDVGVPALLIGMDTPQVTRRLLEGAMERLQEPGIDAVLGMAEDGGWWAIGLNRLDPEAFLGVPMSTPVTGRAQRERLGELGLRVAALPPLRDVDQIEDAFAVAGLMPGSRLAATLRAAAGPPAGTGAVA